jgi:Tfp pilus assembly protein PilF
MTSRWTSRSALAGLLLSAVLAAACGNPAQQKLEHIARGDTYMEARKPREAVIEYRKAVQIDPEWGEAHRKLARAYMEANEPGSAYEAYARAADIDPDDVGSAMAAGELLLAGGAFDRARARAEMVLQRHPRNVDAQILLGHALAGLDRPEAAIEQIREAIELEPDAGRAYAALGAVQLAQGARREAEAAFKEAVARAPHSREAHLALATYYLSTTQQREAEQSFRRAHELDPEGELTNRALATFLVASGRPAEAEPYFVAAGHAHPRSKLILSDYYVTMSRLADAERALDSLAGARDLEESVQTRRAAIRYASGAREEAHEILGRLIADQKAPGRALLLRGRFLLTEGHADEASDVLTRAVKAEPASTAAHYALGVAHLARRDLDAAERAFDTVTRLNPRAAMARLQLAAIAMDRGQLRRATALTREAADADPTNLLVQAALVRTLRAAGEGGRAEAELVALLRRHPESGLLWAERGALKLDQQDLAGARTAFTRAAAAAPTAFEPLAGLTMVDVAEQKVRAARARLAPRVVGPDPDPRVLVLAGRVAAHDGDLQEAERLLRRAVAAAPDNLDAYAHLGSLYVSTGRLDEAQREFARLERAQPVTAHTMNGLILEAQDRTADARAAYERALAADPSAAVAANNLAWLQLQVEGSASHETVRLAAVAQRSMPDRPEMNHTLGWMLHKSGDSRAAIPHLERAVVLKPESALYHSHLGLALAESGDRARARTSLERALTLDQAFTGHDETRAVLAGLSQR